ncbi:MAG: trypsin-like peptidase domain-containing protein [Bacteroidota bacterium]
MRTSVLRPALVAVLALAASGAHAEAAHDPLRLQLFGTVDRQAVEVGGLLEINIEALAVPATEAAREALADAMAALDVADRLGAGFAVVRTSRLMHRRTDGVDEYQRRIVVRVLDLEAREIPPVRLDVALGSQARTYQTRPIPIQPYVRTEAVREAGRSVVAITAEGTLDGIRFERIGSAFLVGDDALVTAYHVVVAASRVRVTLPDGRTARVRRAWALDPTRDVAVLHLDAEVARDAGLRPLVVAPPAASGAVSMTAGWPGRERAETVARRYDDLVLGGQRLRVAANAVRPGDSGGPLLDGQGRVLGVVISGRSTGGAADLLDATICLAANPVPALGRYRDAERPVALRSALRRAAASVPAARAHEAVGAITFPVQREGADRRVHVASLLDALRQAPGDPVLQFLAGSVLEEVGEDRLAAGALDASRRAGYAPAAYSLAHHLMDQGRHYSAAQLFGEMSASGPYATLASFGRAQALVALGRPNEAEASLEAVLDHDPRFAPALYLLGLVRLAQGREAEARALVVRLRTRPEWASALQTPIDAPSLRPPALQPHPRVALR